MKTAIGLFLCFGAASWVMVAQDAGTYASSDVLGMLKDDAKKAQIVQQLDPRRPTFDFSKKLAGDWEKAGLTKDQLDAILKREEARATGYIRTFNTALITYASTYNKGYPATLAPMGLPAKGVTPSLEKADLIQDWLASGHPGGNYVFVYKPASIKGGPLDSYTIVARPLVWHDGVRGFFTDQSARIRGTTENRDATVKDPPL